MKKRKKEGGKMESSSSSMITWQSPAVNPPQPTDYIFLNGRRHVRPYYFEFISHVNKRWAGKTIVDLFADEFRGRPLGYYVSAVNCGRIQVDGKTVPISYVVRSSQKLTHYVHRHEPPVMALDITILHKEPDVLTIFKPATVPVHSCGQYRKNTVVGILEAEYGLAPLFPIHRLDRLVSGLLILARTAAKADSFRQQIEGGLIQKQYIAKVIGVFPEGEQVVDANILHDAREGRSSAEDTAQCGDKPVKGKVSCTKFTRISTNGTQSIILCEPISGRTHQIRVHLQHMGYPIANDMLYLSESVKKRSTEGMGADRAAVKSGHHMIFNQTKNCADEFENLGENFSIDPMCTNCPNLAPRGYEEHEEGLWLHCFRYSGPDWVYECPYPEWASLG